MKTHTPTTKRPKKIPPGPEATYDELIAYHARYSLDELERAGYAEVPSLEEERGLQAAASYQLLCERGLQIKLSRRDCQRVAELAASLDQDVETLVKGWVKEHLGHVSGAARNGAVRKSAEKVER